MKETIKKTVRSAVVADDSTICEAIQTASKECQTFERMFDERGEFIGLKFSSPKKNWQFFFGNKETRVFIEEIR